MAYAPYEVIKLTARNGSIEITSGKYYEDDYFYDAETGELKVDNTTDDITVNVTPDEGATFSYLEMDGTNQGNKFVSIDSNGVATFHIRGRNEDAGSNYYGNDIVAVCDMAATPAPDEPTPDAPSNDDDQKQCTDAVRDYIVEKAGVENFGTYYSKALNDYANYEASGSQDFAGWFVVTFMKRESEYVPYISGLLIEGFTHLDIMTVWEYAGGMTGLEYTFNRIRNSGKTYGRYVEINGTTGNIGGDKQNFCEFHLKGGFSGEKAVIDGVSYYVVDVMENNGWHTREEEGEIGAGGKPLPNTTVREYCEPVCLIDDGRCYFKSRTTTNPDEMFLYINGGWLSVGYVALAFAVTSGNYTIEYSGNDITPAELVARKVDEYSVRMSSMMSRLSAVLTERNGLRKAGKVLSSMDIAYKSMVDSIRDMLQ